MYLSAIRHLHCVLTTFLRPFVAFVGSINDQSVDRHWNIIIYDNACFEVKQKKWIYRTKRLNVDRTPYYLRILYPNLRFGEVILPFTKLSSFTKKYWKVTQLLERSKKKILKNNLALTGGCAIFYASDNRDPSMKRKYTTLQMDFNVRKIRVNWVRCGNNSWSHKSPVYRWHCSSGMECRYYCGVF